MTQAQAVENRLREMILDMELGPGEPVTERWAETQLGASRTPVRAALLRLEVEGLVRREGRGWIVTPLDLREIEQLFVYREILETGAVRLAASRINEDILATLEARLASGRDLSRQAAQRVGTEFHVWLAELSGNDFLRRGVADVMTRLARVRWLDTGPEHHGWDEHRRILQALRQGRAEQAASLLAAHIEGSRDRLLTILKSAHRSLRARGIALT